MPTLKVSVIIPAYNQGRYLPDAVSSVLSQTYQDFELVIVNDGSSDDTHDVIARFDDQRIKYLSHVSNCGVTAARNTGIRASSGDLIAFLDADDFFHRQKLEIHVRYLEDSSHIGVTYNPRFELSHSARTVRGLWRPPRVVSLSDLVLGFPFGPSDMVLRREWILRVGLFDESYSFYGDDLDLFCRLALSGCQFSSVDRALSFRRYHSGRIIRDIPASVESALRPLHTTFSDPRCPRAVLALRGTAYANHYLDWGTRALAQAETGVGQRLFLDAVHCDSSILQGEPCKLVAYLEAFSILDSNSDHEVLLRRMFDQLPPRIGWLTKQVDSVIRRACLRRGVREVIWGRPEQGKAHLKRAEELGAELTAALQGEMTQQLLDYEAELGPVAAETITRTLSALLRAISTRWDVRRFRGRLSVNRAFVADRCGRQKSALANVFRAIVRDPTYLANRGVLSVLLRSTGRSLIEARAPAVGREWQRGNRRVDG